MPEMGSVVGRIVVWVAVIATAIYLLTPLIVEVLMSFEPSSILRFPITGFSLKWYQFFFTNSLFISGMRVSFALATVVALISVLLAIPSSMAFVRYSFPGKRMLTALFTSPLSAPAVVVGVGLLYWFSLLKFSISFFNLVIGHLLLTYPYALRTITATLVGFDRSLEEASMSLGANEIQTFQKITFPIISPGIIASLIFSIAVSLDDVGVAIFLVTTVTQTLNIAMLGYWRWVLDPTVGAASTFLIMVALALTIVAERIVGLERFLF